MIKLTTKNLILRRFQISDLPEIKQLMLDAETMKYTGYKEAQEHSFIIKELKRWIKESSLGMYYWHVSITKSKDFVGWAMLKKTISEFYEVGFMLSKSQWGKGYATELAQAIIKFTKEELKEKKILASIHIENLASRKVIEKLGMIPSQNYISENEILYFEKDL